MDGMWKPSCRREALGAIVREQATNDWKEEASVRICMEGADEKPTILKILRDITVAAVQMASE